MDPQECEQNLGDRIRTSFLFMSSSSPLKVYFYVFNDVHKIRKAVHVYNHK